MLKRALKTIILSTFFTFLLFSGLSFAIFYPMPTPPSDLKQNNQSYNPNVTPWFNDEFVGFSMTKPTGKGVDVYVYDIATGSLVDIFTSPQDLETQAFIWEFLFDGRYRWEAKSWYEVYDIWGDYVDTIYSNPTQFGSNGINMDFGVDTIGPTGSIKINNDAQFTNTRNVNLNLTANDTLSGIYQLYVFETGVSPSGWQSFSQNYGWTLAPGDGLKDVGVFYRDNALNDSAAGYYDWIILDTAPPNQSSTNIGSASHQVNKWSNSNNISVSLSSFDTLSQIDGYAFNFSKDNPVDPGTTKNYEENENSFTAVVNDGSWYLNLRAVDNAGNWTQPVSSGPYLIDRMPPSFPNISSMSSTNNSVSFSWDASTDDLSGIAYYEIQKAPDVSDSPGTFFSLASTASLNYTDGVGPNTRVWYQIRALDVAGTYSNYTLPFKITTLADAPVNPEAISFSRFSMDVGWLSGGSEDHFELYSSSNSYLTPIYNGTLWWFRENNLTPNTSYTYRIYAVNKENVKTPNYIEASATTLSNNAPVLNPIGNKVVDEGGALQFIVSATDADTNPVDTLTYSAGQVVGGVFQQNVYPSGATFNVNNGVFDWGQTAGQVGSYTIRFLVSDGYASDHEDVTINVFNNEPIAVLTVNPNPAELGQAVTLDATGSSHGRPDRQIVEYEFDFDGDSNFDYAETATNAPDGSFDSKTSYTYNTGLHTAAVRVTDNNYPSKTATASYQFTVNGPPVLDPIGNKTVDENTLLQFTVTGKDPDNFPALFVTFKAGQVTGGVFQENVFPSGVTWNSQTKQFSWTPTSAQVGNYTIRFQVSDTIATDSEDIIITVNDKTPPPEPTIASSTHASSTGYYSNNDPSFLWNASDSSGIQGANFLLNQSESVHPAQANQGLTNPVAYTDIGNGKWYFHVIVQDGANNWSACAHKSVNIDTYKPRTSAPRRARVRKGRYTNLYYKVYDPFTGNRADVSIIIKKGRKVLKKINLKNVLINVLKKIRIKASFPKGKYKFFVKARDKAGNPQYNIARNYLIIY